MSIYMGEDGQVQIRRRGLAAIPTTLSKDDVVVVDRRFSADFSTKLNHHRRPVRDRHTGRQ